MTAKVMRYRPFLWVAVLALLVGLLQAIDFAVVNVVNGVPNPDEFAAAQSIEPINWIIVVIVGAVIILAFWLDRRVARRPRAN
jgi:hypothetical protein